MKPQELRIGNYLHDREENLCQVIELERERIYAPVIGKTITGLPNKPIELTEEWLLKLGFEKKAEYIVKSDFINMLKELIKELEVDDMVSLTVEYESNFGGKLIAEIENIELEDLRKPDKL